MVASVGWAEETLYQFQSKSWTAVLGDNVTAANWTSGKDGNSYAAGQGVQITTGVSGANATSPIFAALLPPPKIELLVLV